MPRFNITTRETYQCIIAAQDKYISFLDKHLAKISAIAIVHGYKFSQEDIDEGIKLRKEIADIPIIFIKA